MTMVNYEDLMKDVNILKIKLRTIKEVTWNKRRPIIEKLNKMIEYGEPYIYTHEVQYYLIINDEINSIYGEFSVNVENLLNQVELFCRDNLNTPLPFPEKPIERVGEDKRIREDALPEDIEKDVEAKLKMVMDEHLWKKDEKAMFSYRIFRLYPEYRKQIKKLIEKKEWEGEHKESDKNDMGKDFSQSNSDTP